MFHCVKFFHFKIIYLFDSPSFRHRTITIGVCPKCGKLIAELKEERKADGKTFVDIKSGIEAHNFLKKIETQINYSWERKKEKNLPIGWKFGINIETKAGEIKQYASDFRGNKELVKVSLL